MAKLGAGRQMIGKIIPAYRYLYYHFYLTWSTSLRHSGNPRLNAVFTMSMAILFVIAGGMRFFDNRGCILFPLPYFRLGSIAIIIFTSLNVIHWNWYGSKGKHSVIVNSFEKMSASEQVKGKLLAWGYFFTCLGFLYFSDRL